MEDAREQDAANRRLTLFFQINSRVEAAPLESRMKCSVLEICEEPLKRTEILTCQLVNWWFLVISFSHHTSWHLSAPLGVPDKPATLPKTLLTEVIFTSGRPSASSKPVDTDKQICYNQLGNEREEPPVLPLVPGSRVSDPLTFSLASAWLLIDGCLHLHFGVLHHSTVIEAKHKNKNLSWQKYFALTGVL